LLAAAEEDPDLRAHLISKGLISDDDDGPDLDPELAIYWTAWNILRDDRHFGAMGGGGMIYYSAISRYARDNAITGSDFSVFVTLVREMDSEYLLWLSEQNPPTSKQAPP
jgi:hypothetical protein